MNMVDNNGLGLHLVETTDPKAFVVTLGNGTPIAYQRDGQVMFAVGDRIAVKESGTITYAVKPGKGCIWEVLPDGVFHVLMDSGENGFVEEPNLKRV